MIASRKQRLQGVPLSWPSELARPIALYAMISAGCAAVVRTTASTKGATHGFMSLIDHCDGREVTMTEPVDLTGWPR